MSAAAYTSSVESRQRTPVGTLAFELSLARRGRRDGSIHAIELGAAVPRAITPRPPPDEHRLDSLPTWSPDGGRMAFVRRSDRGSGVYVVRGDGADLRRILTVDKASTRGVWPLAWSPDGVRLAFDRYGLTECRASRPFRLRFTVADVDAGASVEIDALPAPRELVRLGDIRWSPDGARLLYVVYELDDLGGRPQSRLYTIGADGRGRRLIEHGQVYAAAWAPDSRRIAYVDWATGNGGACDLYIVGADGTGGRLVSDDDAEPYSDVAWTPDGDDVLVLGARELRAVDAATGAKRTLAELGEGRRPGRILGFSKAGDAVGFTTSDEGDTVAVVRLEGGAVWSVSLPPAGARGGVGDVSLHIDYYGHVRGLTPGTA